VLLLAADVRVGQHELVVGAGVVDVLVQRHHVDVPPRLVPPVFSARQRLNSAGSWTTGSDVRQEIEMTETTTEPYKPGPRPYDQ